MSLRLYNSLTRRLEDFLPLDPNGKSVGMYVCGPTVYDVPHLGHLRSAFVFDLMRRVLAARGYDVRFVRNVTDVDDKIIDRARRDGDSADLNAACEAVAKRYLDAYHQALAALDIQQPTVEPKATEHVLPSSDAGAAKQPEVQGMTDLISKLLISGTAYEAKGDVYFAVRKFAGYGKLSNRSLDDLMSGARIEPGEHKNDPLDFALWKAAKRDEPSWTSPWGKGRPGWHIECSTMSVKYLGGAFDIHGGGLDLIFPHHENELAQAQAAGFPFAKYWVHHGLLTVNGEKMAKSLGNYITVEDALKASDGQAEALKMLFLGTQYRNPLDYTEQQLRGAGQRLQSLRTVLHYAAAKAPAAGNGARSPEIEALRAAFDQALDDDLNTPQALAVLDQLGNLGHQHAELLGQTAAAIREKGGVLGLFQTHQSQSLSPEQRSRLDEREAARQRRDFKTADAIRKEFDAAGLTISDTPDGPVVIPK